MKNNTQLKILNTFAIHVEAARIITVYDEISLLQLWKHYSNNGGSILIVGEGSNILFLENYNGTVLLNRIKGIVITENKTEWKLHVGSGEKWNELVMYTINRNIPGLENLACIPGYVGAAPIQNIGAYGVELSQVCEYVDVIDLYNEYKIRLYNHDCRFQYRDSIFNNCSYRYVIIFVGLKLNKIWKPVLHYHELASFNVSSDVTPYKIFRAIAMIRNRKLPNPVVKGNAGSFFKNPIIDIKTANSLFSNYKNIPYYIQPNGKVKLSAGWLIEKCKLKGYNAGEASVYSKQAAVLINTRQKATGTEIAALAFYIRNIVVNKFDIYLQPEVRLIGKTGEINPNQLFKLFV